MNKKERFIEFDRQLIYFVEWTTKVEKPLGNIVIVHGMAEHVNRYEPFAEYANRKGYNVFGYDQRGHGFTAGSKADLGLIDDKMGWEHYVSDLLCVIKKIREERSNEHIFLFGHSMGSFVSRDFSIRYPDLISGLIMSGCTDSYLTDLLTGITVSKTEKLVKGRKGNAVRVNKLLNDKFVKKFKNRKTDYDWLTTDPKEVKKYIEDPYSGFCPKTSFFDAFFNGLVNLHEPLTYNRISKNMPVLMMSGQQDPVTNMGLGTIRLFEKYQNQGVKDLRMKLYPGMRHEIMNEIDKKSVYKDIINWIEERSSVKLSEVKNHNTAS